MCVLRIWSKVGLFGVENKYVYGVVIVFVGLFFFEDVLVEMICVLCWLLIFWDCI